PGLPQSAAPTLTLDPPSITLKGADSVQRLIVTAHYPDGRDQDVTSRASFHLMPGWRAVLSGPAELAPLANGPAKLTVRVGQQTVSAPVTVIDASKHYPVSFTNDIVPLFTRIGCNQGACHGAAEGQNGFKLSLRGFDPDSDYDQIVKEADGRRVNKKQPLWSLILKKPSADVPHGGGLRLARGAPERELLKRWLLEGMPGPDTKVALQSISVVPASRELAKAGDTQPLLVTAHYSDGSSRDVTAMSRYVSSDDGVASVDENGQVTARHGGEAAVMVAYGGMIQAPRFFVPVGLAPVLRSELPPNNAIDDAIFSRLARLRIHPSGLSTDLEFLRRVTLDISGELPTPADAQAFLRDRSPDRRARVIARLLDSPQYVDFRTLKLADLLRVNSLYLSGEGVETYHRWIHDQVAANVPYDQFVRSLLTARGPTFHTGPSNFYRVASAPPELAETTSQAFLGIRMQCARCHNHPFEKWTQTDYYGFAAFFARVGQKGGPEFGESQIVVNTGGDVRHPRTNVVIPPHPLGGPAIKVDDSVDRRIALADWLTAPTNVDFARETANRVWADMFGKGIIDPVDDVRISNPPSNDDLLSLLASKLIEHHYDIKWLIGFIANSRTYQLSSIPTSTNLLDTRHFARALPRRLSAEQALDAISVVTGKRDQYGAQPRGTTAEEISDSRVGVYFLDVFGKPKREIVCACERDMQPNLAQSLHLINSGDVDGKLFADDGWLHTQLAHGVMDSDIITGLYLRALGRYPTYKEMR
ncbi:MAG: DUF1549 domain-containing protein, partial [Chloroflexi bacterium]|nr:DUF1549 domain-containing protein [Chloroflexota bacterium]